MKQVLMFLLLAFAGYKCVTIFFHMIYETGLLILLGGLFFLTAKALFSRRRF